MLEYKSVWKAVSFVPLTKADTHGSSLECASCGERLREPEREDAEHRRMRWCQRCKVWTDRDVNAAINLANYVAASSAGGARLMQEVTGTHASASACR